MKITCTLLLSCYSVLLFGNEISPKSSIKHVTVFQKAAQIERNLKATIPSGKHQIIISNLSTQVDQNSIQLSGDKTLSILSIHFQRNFLKNEQPNTKTIFLQDSLTLMRDKLTDVTNQQWLLREEKDLIMKNKTLSQTGTNNTTEELMKRATYYRTRLGEILKDEKKQTKKQQEIQGVVNRLQAQLNQNKNGRGKSVGEIVVEVQSKSNQTVNFNLTYNINNAGWYPIYNLRSKSIKEPLDLEYNAKVYQNSGIDWKNVVISLSTSNPQANIQKPHLTPWRLAFRTANQYNKNYRGKNSNRTESYAGKVQMDEDAMTVDAEYNTFTPPPVQITQYQTAVSFDLKTKYTIPSDNKQHGVTVANYTLPAQYTYYAAPKMKKKAFLLAQTSDWHQYNLIPGRSNFFFQNRYVGNSMLNLSGMQDTLDLSLGIDENILIQRNRVKDFCKVYAIGSDKKEEIGIEISITNNKNVPIEIVIEDQIPVSTNNQIMV